MREKSQAKLPGEAFAGVDVAKDTLDVCILSQGRRQGLTFRNSGEGARDLAAALCGEGAGLVVTEATGGLEKTAVRALRAAGLAVAVVNPRRARQYASACGVLAKTDRADAYVLALFARDVRPEASPLRSQAVEDVRALAARRAQLVRMRTAELNRQKRAERAIRESIEAVIAVLDDQIAALDARLEEAFEKNGALRTAGELLQSVPGIGAVASRSLLAALPELGRLSGKEAAALAGLAPYARESGTVSAPRFISGGRSAVRCALYMPTLVATNHNPDIRRFYKRLRSKGKPGKVAVTACMRKLLVTLNAVVKRGAKWTPDYP